MADRKSVRLQDRQVDSLSDMVDDGLADDDSKALRLALDTGLRQLGYGATGGSVTQQLAGLVGRWLAFAAAGWLAMTLLFPLEYRLGAVVLVSASAGCFGLERVLDYLDSVAWDTKRPRMPFSRGGD